MGWCVMAFGQIEAEDEHKEKIMNKLNELTKDDSCFLRLDDDLSFEMSGNKGVGYGSLELLQEWALKEKIPMEISTNEYSETGNGFYFNYEDEVDEDEDN